MNYQVARYVIHAYIIPSGKDTYLVKVRADALNEAGPRVDEVISCEPCTYEKARTACYKLVAEIAHTLGTQGAIVADVVIVDN